MITEKREKNSLMYQMIPNKSSQNRLQSALKFDSGMIVTQKGKSRANVTIFLVAHKLLYLAHNQL